MIRLSFARLAVISLVAIIGPLLGLPRRGHLPLILEELAAGSCWGRLAATPAGAQRDVSGSWLTLGSG
jgi:hypothetical protein